MIESDECNARQVKLPGVFADALLLSASPIPASFDPASLIPASLIAASLMAATVLQELDLSGHIGLDERTAAPAYPATHTHKLACQIL